MQGQQSSDDVVQASDSHLDVQVCVICNRECDAVQRDGGRTDRFMTVKRSLSQVIASEL